MVARRLRERSVSECTLAQLCNRVITRRQSYGDLAEIIEDRAYQECEDGRCERAGRLLKGLAAWFEGLRRPSSAERRALADVYVALGELHLYHVGARRGLRWFRKAALVDDTYAAPFHSLAMAYEQLHDLSRASRALEHELLLAPGNYYSYLILADTYEALDDGERFEETLHRLLVRDPQNIQALHRLVVHYESDEPAADVELLRRRIVSVERKLSKGETIIKTFHMCRESRCEQALQDLVERERESPEAAFIHLLKAAVYGELRQFSRKKVALAQFKRMSSGRRSSMQMELKEFQEVFGKAAVGRLSRRLAFSSPSVHQA
jgi:tetratricopeptide (TPR) repeat protein